MVGDLRSYSCGQEDDVEPGISLCSPSSSSDSGYLDVLYGDNGFDQCDMDLLDVDCTSLAGASGFYDDIRCSDLSELLDDFTGFDSSSGELSEEQQPKRTRQPLGMYNLSCNQAVNEHDYAANEHDYAANYPASELKNTVNINPVSRAKQPKRTRGNGSACSKDSPPTKVGRDRQNNDNLPPRNLKNAELARRNRLRKKRYIEGLESELSTSKSQVTKLTAQNKKLNKINDRLTDRVEYLTKVLENETTLGALLSAVTSVPGISFTAKNGISTVMDDDKTSQLPESCDAAKETSSISQRAGLRSSKGSKISKKSSLGAALELAKPSTSGGICLHLSKTNVSVEFCENCAMMASK